MEKKQPLTLPEYYSARGVLAWRIIQSIESISNCMNMPVVMWEFRRKGFLGEMDMPDSVLKR